jgi:hypothetical protein
MIVDRCRVGATALWWGRGVSPVRRRRRAVLGTLGAAVTLGAGGWVAGAPAAAQADAEAGSGGRVDAAGTPASSGERRARVILPVWALLDGDTPVSRARVRVYAGDLRAGRRRRPLREVRIERGERTHKSGVALLVFRRLPRNFTVVVRGGRSEGRRLRGFLSAQVRGYRDGRVVHVNPVTTLVELWRRVNPRVGHRRATRAVSRALGIPSWVDHVDLRASDRWLDGDRFLRHVRVHATLDRATGDLLFDIRRGERTRRFRARRARPAAARSLGRLTGEPSALHGGPVARAAQGPAGLIATVFARLAAGVASGVASKASGAALGWVLSAFGLRDDNELLRRDLDEIKKTLDQLTSQVTQLQGQVERTGFSTLAHQTDTTIGQIDHSMSQLALLADLPASDPTKAAFARKVVDYIGSRLLDAPAILNQNLGSNVPLADNLIKSASRLVSTRDRFFDKETSDQVKSVYDYFAAYQAKLAILLVEYYHTEPGTYSPTVVKANLDRIEGNVTAQASSLKPPVPDGVVVDIKTGLMWMQAVSGPSIVQLGDLIELQRNPIGIPSISLKPLATSTALPGLPFSNWSLSTFDEMNRLLSHRGDNSPYQWLLNHARIASSVLRATQSHFWLRDTFSTGVGGITVPRHQLCYELYSLDIAGTAERTCKYIDTVTGREFVLRIGQATLYFRRPAAGEDYWWG